MPAPPPTREDDELLLRGLAIYQEGKRMFFVARAMRRPSANAASAAVRAVIEADCQHDPAAAAWWRANTHRKALPDALN